MPTFIPIWQREIGFLLRQSFPRMQFIVTSHSPFVAQAASDGGLIVLRRLSRKTQPSAPSIPSSQFGVGESIRS